MKFMDRIGEVYRHRQGRWLLHILFWVLFFGARVYINHISINPYKSYSRGILLSNLYATVTTAFSYYVLVYFIYEKLYSYKKYTATGFAFITLILAYTVLDFLGESLLMQDPEWVRLVRMNAPEYYQYLQRSSLNILASRMLSIGILYQLFINLALPLLIRVAIAYNKKRVQTAELARQNVQLEFNFLKSQVNPHFLHNTLNNIYSLIIHDKKTEAAATVARLSAFMRYSMHDAGMEQVAADKEIQLMQDYIELEKIRLNYTKVLSRVEIDGTSYQLPPLLLMPILENAFKYNTDQKGSNIEIELQIKKNELRFYCRNDFDPAIATTQQQGIGLANVKKRLEQYFPGKFHYQVSTANNVYSVNLSITFYEGS